MQIAPTAKRFFIKLWVIPGIRNFITKGGSKMKKKSWLVLTGLLVGLFIVPMSVGADTLLPPWPPSCPSIGELKVIQIAYNFVTLDVPVPSDQQSAQDWINFGSIAYLTPNGWNLVGEADYSLTTTRISSSYLRSTIYIPAEAYWGTTWLRLWAGKVACVNCNCTPTSCCDGCEWLTINEKSKYMRLDECGNPAYEVKINHSTRQYSLIPACADPRP